MPTPLIIIGAGGFGRETVDVVRAQASHERTPTYELLGIVDSCPSSKNLDRMQAMSVPYLGTEQDWLENETATAFIVAIGNPTIRRAVSRRFERYGYKPATAVHPSVTLGSVTTMAGGAVICAGAHIATHVVIGRHVHINANATVGHDAVIQDYVSVNPGAIISGNVRCESEVLVGAGAVVLQGLTVGSGTTVGAAACVTKDVPGNQVAVGVPARWKKYE